MRDIITGLAIILIVALTAALAAPYFIDWNGQRAFVEARLSRALGQKVTIGGDIDLKLLPTPYIVLSQTVIGGDDGPIRIGIHHLALELSIAPLLHGEFEVVDARLEEPTIRVTLERDRTLPALPDAPAFQADVRFDRVSVKNGTLAIADPSSGHTFVFDALDFDADAPSLAGPFKGSGAEGAAGARTKFRFATTTAQNGRARAHLAVEETRAHAGLDLDGTLALTSAARQTIRQSFDGTMIVSGHLDQAEGAPVAWRLSGPLKADPAKATLSGGELRLGREDAGLTMAAIGEADLGAAPTLRLDLSAKQLDIDRLAGAPVDQTVPPPPKLPDLATLRHVLSAATPPLPLVLDLSIDNATWGGETLSDLAAHVGLGGEGAQRLQIGGDGPGGAHVGIDGTLAGGASPTFAGAVEIAAANGPRALAWLASIDPSLGLKPSDLPFRSIKLTGKVRASGERIDADDLALGLDRSSLEGTARVDLAARPAKVVLDLSAKALDLDTLPDLSALRGSAEPFDLDLKLAANAIKVTRAGEGALDTGHIDLALTKSGGTVTLTRFQAQNLGGAGVAASGRLEAGGATFKAEIQAARLDAFAALVRQVAPSQWADALVARAPALAPAKLTIDAAFASTGGTLHPSRVKANGMLGATSVDFGIEPTGGEAGSVSLGGTLEAPEGGVLLRQLGLRTLPLAILGKSHVSLGARGPADAALDTTAQIDLGATRATLSGRFALLSSERAGSGSLVVKSPDVSPLLQSLALAFPDMTGTIPADARATIAIDARATGLRDIRGKVGGVGVAGALAWAPDDTTKPALTGALSLDRLALADFFGLALGPPQPAGGEPWSGNGFASGLVDPPRAALSLKIADLAITPSLVARDATMDLGVARDLVTMKSMTAMLGSGHLTGTVSLRRDGAQGAVEGKVGLDKVAIDLPGLTAKASGTLDLAGSGTSALGLVSSLAGTGTATLADTRFAAADPAALPKVFDQVESDDLTVDEETIVRALRETASKPLDAGARAFTLGLAGGVVKAEEKPAPIGDAPVTSLLGLSLDLRHATLGGTARETLRALPKGWSGPPPSVVFAFAGTPEAPSRSIDASAFIDALATRALARESARIETYEFDLRERALFNQRLQSERRREQDRLKAEADRRARIEAARLEKARKEAEAAREQAAEAERVQAERAQVERAKADRAKADKLRAAQDQAVRDRGPEPPRAAQPETSPAPPDPFAPSADPSSAGRY